MRQRGIRSANVQDQHNVKPREVWLMYDFGSQGPILAKRRTPGRPVKATEGAMRAWDWMLEGGTLGRPDAE